MTPDQLTHFISSALLDSWYITLGAASETHCSLERSTPEGTWALIRFPSQIAIWGPDRLQVQVPDFYNWEQLVANLSRCDICGATSTPIERFSYAGRACPSCASTQPPPDSKD